GPGLLTSSRGRVCCARSYARHSPTADQSPKWYCETCSMQKNLQRDFRDIRAEYDKLSAGQGSALSNNEEFRRASLRLREIVTILDAAPRPSPLIATSDVNLLLERFNTATMPA